MNITIEDLKKIKKENPTLWRHGFEKKLNWIEKVFIPYEEVSFDEFKKCTEWMLENLEPKTQKSRFELDSYAIKHIIEQQLGGHISHGSAIAAGIFLKLPTSRIDGKSMIFKVKSKVKQTRF